MSESMVLIRPFDREEDEPLIYSTWRNALWFAEKREEHLSDEFYHLATKEIRSKLSDPAYEVRIACLADLPVLTLGYSVLNGQNLDWVYVKADYRRKGIGKLLTQGFKTVSSPRTRIGKGILEDKSLSIQKEELHEETL